MKPIVTAAALLLLLPALGFGQYTDRVAELDNTVADLSQRVESNTRRIEALEEKLSGGSVAMNKPAETKAASIPLKASPAASSSTSWIEEKQVVTVRRPKITTVEYGEPEIVETAPAVSSAPIVQAAPVYAAPVMTPAVYSAPITSVSTTRSRTRSGLFGGRLFRRSRAKSVSYGSSGTSFVSTSWEPSVSNVITTSYGSTGSRPMAFSAGPRWTWPGNLSSHLQGTHGVSTAGLSRAEQIELHDRLHNGY